MDKRLLVEQLARRLRESARVAEQASEAAAEEARSGATPAERREDSRTALEFSRMARAQARRATQTRSDLDALAGWQPATLPAGASIELGALVEVEDEQGHGLTFFLAPVGAGEELAGPGGDGFLSVATPASPLGRAVIGRRVGDTVEVRLEGGLREWTIVWAG
jgi:transcription elongation GreA/GreB family factor